MSEYPEEAELDLADDARSEVESGQAEHYEPRSQPGSTTLGDTARQRRELLGITQEDVAERFHGPSVASLRTIENGQSDSYRAKTLFALDTALAWPTGASMTLLTGRSDRLNGREGWQFINSILDPWSRNTPLNDSALEPWEFDTLVDNLIKHIPDDDAIRYDIPIRSASSIYTLKGDPPVMTRIDRAGEPKAPQSEPREAVSTVSLPRSEKMDAILTLMDDLDIDELEELGNFAINLAKLSRLLKGEWVQEVLDQYGKEGMTRMEAIMQFANKVAKYGETRDDGER